MLKKNWTLIFISDPSHGWLEVPLGLFNTADVKASQYSYYDAFSAYLEEDCDAPRFINAIKNKGYEIKIIEKNLNRHSKIRSLNRMKGE